MKKTLTALSLFCLAVVANGQMNAEKYAETITSKRLKDQLSIIAGDAMQGRETATEGQRKAAAYIAGEFQQAGLTTVPGAIGYQQTFPLFYDTLLNSKLEINGKELVYGKDYIATLQANENAKISSKKIVFVGYGITDSLYDDYAGKNVKGNVVMIFAGEPKQGDRYILSGTNRPSRWSTNQATAAKARLAKENGAKAVIFIIPALAEFKPEMAAGLNRSAIYYPRAKSTPATTVNLFTLSHQQASMLMGAKFDELLTKAVAQNALNTDDHTFKSKIKFRFDELPVPQFSSNVIGMIEGTDKKDEYVILTGHYDHLGVRGGVIYNGADDDGSGTTSVIEMAKAFAKAKAEGNGPRRSIVFMTVSGEEKGLWGSQYYSENPLLPLNKTSVNLNTDMVGRIDPDRKYGDSTNYVYLIGEDKLSSDLPAISDSVNNQFVHIEMDRKFNANDPNRFYYRSDHYNFAKMGVPIIFYFNGTHADYHKSTDTVDKINFDLMAKRVHLIFHTAWVMANRNDMLKRDIPLR